MPIITTFSELRSDEQRRVISLLSDNEQFNKSSRDDIVILLDYIDGERKAVAWMIIQHFRYHKYNVLMIDTFVRGHGYAETLIREWLDNHSKKILKVNDITPADPSYRYWVKLAAKRIPRLTL